MRKGTDQMPTKQTLDGMTGSQPAHASSKDFGKTSEPVDPELLAEVDPVAASMPRPTFSNDTDFAEGETFVPKLRLLQGLSPEVRKEGAKEGTYALMGFDPVETVTLVLAGRTHKRRYIVENKVKCQSPDGEQGYGEPGIPCAECPLSKWTDSGKRNPDGSVINNAPPCNAILSYAAFSVTHGMPIEWELKGTAMRASKFINTLAKGLGWPVVIELGSVRRVNGQREWVEPTTKIAKLDPAEAQAYAAMAIESLNPQAAEAALPEG